MMSNFLNTVFLYDNKFFFLKSVLPMKKKNCQQTVVRKVKCVCQMHKYNKV